MVNRALTSLNGGSFEIALTVPLSPRKFKEQGVYIDKIFDYYGLQHCQKAALFMYTNLEKCASKFVHVFIN